MMQKHRLPFVNPPPPLRTPHVFVCQNESLILTVIGGHVVNRPWQPSLPCHLDYIGFKGFFRVSHVYFIVTFMAPLFPF